MGRNVSRQLFSMSTAAGDGGRLAWRRVSAREMRAAEDWFQQSIFANPELVLAPCREAGIIGDEQWFPWAKELPVPEVGSVDVALVCETGRVALVETKLAYNPGARREVVAQLLEYATHVRESVLDDLPALPQGPSGLFPDRQDVEDHLLEGDFLLVVAGDDLDSRAVRLGHSLLGRHLVHPWDLVLVDLAMYESSGEDREAGQLCVPHLRGMLTAERRQVVTVRVDMGKGSTEVVIADPPSDDGSRRAWNPQQFIADMDRWNVGQGFRRMVGFLLALPNTFPTVSAVHGTGRKGCVVIKRNRAGLVEVYANGEVYFRKPKVTVALGPDLAAAYLTQIAGALPGTVASEKDYYLHPPKAEVEKHADDIVRIIEHYLTLAEEPHDQRR